MEKTEEKLKVKNIKEKKKTDKKKVNKENEVEKKLREENRNLNDKVLRISAEMQNMRRRYEDEISNI